MLSSSGVVTEALVAVDDADGFTVLGWATAQGKSDMCRIIMQAIRYELKQACYI